MTAPTLTLSPGQVEALDRGLRSWCERDPQTGRRLLYTGVTRARDTLTAFDAR